MKYGPGDIQTFGGHNYSALVRVGFSGGIYGVDDPG